MSTAPISFTIIESVDELRKWTSAWDALYQSSHCTTPALHHSAVCAFVAHRVKHGQRAVVVLASRDDELIGALPLTARKNGRRQEFDTFSDAHTYGVEFLLDPSEGSTVVETMIDWLLRSFPDLFSIRLHDVSEGCADARVRQLSGIALCDVQMRRMASYLPVPSGPDEIMGRLSTNFRKNLRKQQARLRAQTDVRFDFTPAAASRSEAFGQFTALEASGWKGRGGTAIAQADDVARYYGDLVAGLSQSGHLEWHTLSIGDKLIAAHMAVRTQATVSLLKIAYDEEFASIAPGNLLLLELLRRESAGGSREIDCVTDMPWHRNWRMDQRAYYTLTLFPKKVLPAFTGYFPAIARRTLRRISVIRSMFRLAQRLWNR